MKKIIFLAISFFLINSCSSTIKKSENNIGTFESDKNTLTKYGPSLSLQEAIEIGINRNLNLKVKKLEQEISLLDKNIAFSNFLPKINILATQTQFNNDIYGQVVGSTLPFNFNLETRLFDKNFYSNAIGFSLPIFVPSSWFLYSSKKKNIDLKNELLSLEEKLLKVQIIINYYQIQALIYEKYYLESQLRFSNELVKNSKLALENKSILNWEHNEAILFHETKQIALNKNKRDLEYSKMNFLVLLNLNPMLEIKLEEENLFCDKTTTIETAIMNSLKNNSLIKSSSIVKSMAEDYKKMAFTNFLPKIILSGGYYTDDNAAIVNSNIIFGSINGLFTLFNGFENINLYKKSSLNLKIAEIETNKTILQVILETCNSFNTIKNLKEVHSLNQKFLSITKDKLEQKRLEYKLGFVEKSEFLNAVSSYDKAVTDEKNSYFMLQISLAIFDLIIGGNE